MLRQGDVIREYEIRSVLGRGGFGVVYRAKHEILGLDVAVKEYFPAELSIRHGATVHSASPEFEDAFKEGLRRFLEEGQQLEKFRECPTIVTCRDLFRANGTVYMVMEHVEGVPLSVLLEGRESHEDPLTERDLLGLLLPLLHGLQTVHESDVYHRDIKPSNILVRREDGTPVLIDFGAAKQVTSKHTKSLAPYTDGYAAMEQVGEGELGSWTDIYGIGAVMWRIVAGGAPPFTPPTPVTVQRRAFDLMQKKVDPLPSAKEVGRGRFSDGILQTIDDCLKITPDERIQTCTQLIERITPETPTSRPHQPPPVQPEFRTEQLTPEATSVTATPKQEEHSNPQNTPRKLTSNRAILTLLLLLGFVVVYMLTLFFFAYKVTPRPLSGQLLDPTSRIHEVRNFSHDNSIRSVAFSPDGTMLASGALDNTVRVWNVKTATEERRFSHDNSVRSVAFSPDGTMLASGALDKTVRVWNISTAIEVLRLSHNSSVRSVAFSPDGTMLASGSWDNTVRVWGTVSED